MFVGWRSSSAGRSWLNEDAGQLFRGANVGESLWFAKFGACCSPLSLTSSFGIIARMKKPLPFLFASTLFISGVLVGLVANSGSRAQERSTGQGSDAALLTSTLVADTSMNIACLQRLRQGERNVVISVLELRIDSDLVRLADRLSALPRSERDPQQLQVVKMFRDYRAKHPTTNSVAYVQEGITRAYGLLAVAPKEGH